MAHIGIKQYYRKADGTLRVIPRKLELTDAVPCFPFGIGMIELLKKLGTVP